jgi:hypothetical protein
MLVLQSKRMMLASLERRLQKEALESLVGRADRLRDETANAQEQYSSSMLKWGSPERAGYWPVAYARLVETADRLFTKMRRAVVDMPPAERFQLAAEVEMLEVLVEGWREAIRASVIAVA